jgi:hypothetical protein
MEEQLHAVLNSELGKGTGNRHAWVAVQLQKYTPVPTGLEDGVLQSRSECCGEQTSLPIPNIEQRCIDRRQRGLARISSRLLRRLYGADTDRRFAR